MFKDELFIQSVPYHNRLLQAYNSNIRTKYSKNIVLFQMQIFILANSNLQFFEWKSPFKGIKRGPIWCGTPCIYNILNSNRIFLTSPILYINSLNDEKKWNNVLEISSKKVKIIHDHGSSILYDNPVQWVEPHVMWH